MTDKPTPEQIARNLRRMLYCKANPSDNDYTQCRTMQVSYPDFVKMSGYAETKDIPYVLFGEVIAAALEEYLVVGFGTYTVLVGGDFHCEPQYPEYEFKEASCDTQ